MKGKVWDINSLDMLSLAVREVLENAQRIEDSDGAVVLALTGDLGTGKTTFTQQLAKELGVTDKVTSPTFVIMKKYSLSSDYRFKNLVHIDAYRLEDPKELLVLNVQSELQNKDNLVVIEWAEKVASLLPSDIISLNFNLDVSQRTLTSSI